MNDYIVIDTNTNNMRTIDKPTTIREYKEQGKWPFSFISGKGLIKIIDNHATQLGRNVVGLEIGVCKGENIVHFLEHTNKIEKIYGIDPYLPYMDWIGMETEENMRTYESLAKENLAPFSDKVELIKDYSSKVSDRFSNEFFDYIFIDGDHSYEGTKGDMMLYYSKLKPGGIFAGHDINLQSVQQAVVEFTDENSIDRTKINYTETNVWYWYK